MGFEKKTVAKICFEWFTYLYILKLLPGVYPSTAKQEAICIGSWPNLAKACISYRGNGNSWFWNILNRNCIDILCMLYCYTRGFLTTSFVIGKWGTICSSGLLWIVDGFTIPNSDFMEISRGFRKTHPKETCQQFPSASHGELKPLIHCLSLREVYRCPKRSWQRLPGTRRMTSPCFLWNWADPGHNVPIQREQQTQREFVWPGKLEVGCTLPKLNNSLTEKRPSQIQKFNLPTSNHPFSGASC